MCPKFTKTRHCNLPERGPTAGHLLKSAHRIPPVRPFAHSMLLPLLFACGHSQGNPIVPEPNRASPRSLVTPPSVSASHGAAQKTCRNGTASRPTPLAGGPPSVDVTGPPTIPLRGKSGGHLDPQDVQRVMRQHYGQFRVCYESSLCCCPNLEARVTVSFVIDIDGRVKQSTLVSSDASSSALGECVVRAYLGIQFPPPEGGTVTVVYPIMFFPGG